MSLNQPFWNIATFGGSRFSLPPMRGTDIPVAFQAGQQWRYKFPDSRVLTLVMWAAGIDQVTGNPATDQRLAFNNNYQQLRAMFWARNLTGSVQGQLTRQWWITQAGSTAIVSATALAEIAGTMEPTMTGRTRGDFSVDLLLADPYFYGGQQTQTLAYNTNTTVTNKGDGVAAEGSGSFFTITFNGPLTNPTLTNSSAGVSVTWTGVITGGHSVVLDCVNFLASTDLGANVISGISHAGARKWMGLTPGAQTMKLTSTVGGDTGTCLLTWTPPYL